MSKMLGNQSTHFRIAVVIPTVYKANFSDVVAAILSLSQSFPKLLLNHLEFFIFVDKAAADADLPKIKRQVSRQTGCKVELGWSYTQVGFTGAINQSVTLLSQRRKYDWILVFNDDAVAKPHFWGILPRLVRQQVGVVSCGVSDWEGQVESVGLRHSSWGVTLPVKNPQTSSSISSSKLFSGTCFFVATKTVLDLTQLIGFFFFPTFFAYAEDFELSVRLYRLGIPVTIDSVIRVKHKGSQTSKRGSAFQLFYGLRNDFLVHGLHQRHGFGCVWYVLRFLIYSTLLCWYKGYLLLPLKILGSAFKHRQTLAFWRTTYDQKLPYSYPF